MKSIAAIDLLDGQVVRLVNGKLENKTVYDDNPLEVAKKWEIEGVDTIHIVDLNAALNTGKNNSEMILKIIDTVNIPVQVAGGIRTINSINRFLDIKKQIKVVIGTFAFKQPEIIQKISKKRLNRVIISVDHNKENVMISGWKEFSGIKLFDAIRFYKELGINEFLLTNIDKDGTLEGPDIETLIKINNTFKDIKIISSGGVSNIIDILKLRNVNCYAVILGKALYDEKLKIKHVQKLI
jgi:phosphoribosylformimino-5-aminoimidazole carboxamide ribotide isomerase